MIDFTAKLFGLTVKEAALKLVTDFGVSYDARGHDTPGKKPVKPKIRDELRQRQAEQRCFRVYAGYLHLLEDWKERYVSKPEDAEWHLLFVEALPKYSYTGLYAGHAADRHRGRKDSGCGWHTEGGDGA